MPIVVPRTYQRGRRPKALLWASRELFFADLGIFLLGFAGIYSIQVVGSLPGDEVLILPMLPLLLLLKRSRAFSRQYLWFYVLLALWLAGTILADAYNDSPSGSEMKGIARVVFFGFDFMGLAVLLNGRTRRFVIFALSIVAVMFSIARYFRGAFLTQWKFGLASGVMILAFMYSSYLYSKRRYWGCLLVSLALAAINLVFAFRSQVGIVLVSAILGSPLFTSRPVSRTRQPPQLRSVVRHLVLLALIGGCAYAANAAFKLGVEKGLFDEGVSAKFTTQSEGKLGVLFGGRPETLVAIQAIRDRPIIGHGSFAVDQRYVEMMQDIQYENGYTETDNTDENRNASIPTHSHLTMAWVESGVFGGLFWIYILVLAVKAVFRMSEVRVTMAPLYSYLLINFIWDILYSPFGSVNRLWAAYLILVSYLILKEPTRQLALTAPRRIARYPRRYLASRRFA